jgi:TATA-binding protein-associated factor
LFSSAWEVRHGAAMALRELLKAQGKYSGTKGSILFPVLSILSAYFVAVGASLTENDGLHERWCNSLAAKLLCVFILDRFGDFVSDQVVAPVRETVSQTIASLLLHMPRRSVLHVHSVLLQMIRQDFTLPTGTNGPGKEKSHIWEVRHAGLLGIKYEVAVRSDIVEAGSTGEELKAERDATIGPGSGSGVVVKTAESMDVDVGRQQGLDVKMEDIQERNGVRTETVPHEPGPQHILQDVVDAAVLGQV